MTGAKFVSLLFWTGNGTACGPCVGVAMEESPLAPRKRSASNLTTIRLSPWRGRRRCEVAGKLKNLIVLRLISETIDVDERIVSLAVQLFKKERGLMIAYFSEAQRQQIIACDRTIAAARLRELLGEVRLAG